MKIPASVLVAALAGAALAPAAATAEPAIYAGMLVVTSTTPSCQSLLNSTRTMFYSATVFSTGRAAILMSDPYQTITLSPDTPAFAASGAYEATQIDRWNGVSTWKGGYGNFTFDPPKLTARTTSLTITGRLRGFNQDPSCTIGFRAVGVKS